MAIYSVNVYYNGGIEEMGYDSDEPIEVVLKKVRTWLWNRYKRYSRIGCDVNFDTIEYAELELKEQNIYHHLDTFHWKWNRASEETA